MQQGPDPRSDDAPEAIARHVHRLSVLIAAGVSPSSAWRCIADAARPRSPGLDAVATLLDGGGSLATSIQQAAQTRSSAWRGLAAAWAVAAQSGAPLAPALAAFADALRDRAAAERDVAVALAGPRATARMVMLLPLVAVLLALVLGVDLVRAVAHPIGLASVVGGALLLIVARWWMARLLRAAAPPSPVVGLDLDLLAVAAAGGGSPEAALRLVRRELDRCFGPDAGGPAGDSGTRPEEGGADELVELSRRSGAPLGALARSEAREVRGRARTEAQRSAEILAVRLMLPLGACVLPSFLLLGVVPMLVGLISSTTLPSL